MLATILGVYFLVCLFVYAFCRVAGRADDEMERAWAEYQRKGGPTCER